MPYLVQLLYPDYLTGDYGADHFAQDVTPPPDVAALPDAERLAWIVATARAAAVAANEGTPPEDFRVFAVLYASKNGEIEYAADATSGL